MLEPHQYSEHADSRFCQIRTSAQANGSTTPRRILINLATHVSNSSEAKWLRALRSDIEQSILKPGIDLLEVYAQPDSQLAEEVTRLAGKAARFTREHGDLATFSGQVELLRMIVRLRPKNVWVAPECAPWCAWNRFNSARSRFAFHQVKQSQEQSREHLRLCAFVCKLQLNGDRHFTMENPGTSTVWNQPDMKQVMQTTKTVKLDQCQFGLKHPQSQEPLRKNTQLQTTSREIVKNIDGRTCARNHIHHQIEGNCKFRGKTIALSRYAAYYPRIFARTVAKSMMNEK